MTGWPFSFGFTWIPLHSLAFTCIHLIVGRNVSPTMKNFLRERAATIIGAILLIILFALFFTYVGLPPRCNANGDCWPERQ